MKRSSKNPGSKWPARARGWGRAGAGLCLAAMAVVLARPGVASAECWEEAEWVGAEFRSVGVTVSGDAYLVKYRTGADYRRVALSRTGEVLSSGVDEGAEMKLFPGAGGYLGAYHRDGYEMSMGFARLDRLGNLERTEELTMTDEVRGLSTPKAAYTGVSFVAAWYEEHRPDDTQQIVVGLLSPAGDLLGQRVIAQGLDLYVGDVVATRGVVWVLVTEWNAETSAPRYLWGYRIDSSGELLDEHPVSLAEGVYLHDVASNGDQAMVLLKRWNLDASTAETVILDREGIAHTRANLPIDLDPNDYQLVPNAGAEGPDGFVLLHQYQAPIYFTATGDLGNGLPINEIGGAPYRVALDYDRLVVLGEVYDTHGDQRDIRLLARSVSPDGVIGNIATVATVDQSFEMVEYCDYASCQLSTRNGGASVWLVGLAILLAARRRRSR